MDWKSIWPLNPDILTSLEAELYRADMVENPTANLGFSTTATTKKLLGCD